MWSFRNSGAQACHWSRSSWSLSRMACSPSLAVMLSKTLTCDQLPSSRPFFSLYGAWSAIEETSCSIFDRPRHSVWFSVGLSSFSLSSFSSPLACLENPHGFASRLAYALGLWGFYGTHLSFWSASQNDEGCWQQRRPLGQANRSRLSLSCLFSDENTVSSSIHARQQLQLDH